MCFDIAKDNKPGFVKWIVLSACKNGFYSAPIETNKMTRDEPSTLSTPLVLVLARNQRCNKISVDEATRNPIDAMSRRSFQVQEALDSWTLAACFDRNHGPSSSCPKHTSSLMFPDSQGFFDSWVSNHCSQYSKPLQNGMFVLSGARQRTTRSTARTSCELGTLYLRRRVTLTGFYHPGKPPSGDIFRHVFPTWACPLP